MNVWRTPDMGLLLKSGDDFRFFTSGFGKLDCFSFQNRAIYEIIGVEVVYMQHMIVLDLDGSLLNDQSEISDRSKYVIRRLIAAGHIVVIATGRPFSGAYPKYVELALDTPLITDNGGSIQNPMNRAFPKQRTYIPIDVVHDLFRFAEPLISSAFFSVDDIVYAYRYDARLQAFFSGVEDREVVEKPFTELTIEPMGIVFLIQAGKQDLFEAYIDEKHQKTLSYRLWGVDHRHAVYEVYLKHVSKSSAISYLIEHFGLDKNQVIAFGDGVNDVEMLRDAHLGVAMKNGCDEAIAAANDITTHANHEDGVARYLIRHFDLDV
jgi:5-amino-6-(5-phospho-D-ribitylamino)uracil phosphatase